MCAKWGEEGENFKLGIDPGNFRVICECSEPSAGVILNLCMGLVLGTVLFHWAPPAGSKTFVQDFFKSMRYFMAASPGAKSIMHIRTHSHFEIEIFQADPMLEDLIKSFSISLVKSL